MHAFNLVIADAARAAADEVDAAVAAGRDPGPLAGVPIALKDNLCTRGVTTTCSSRILEHWVPPYDATVVQRVVAAGAVVVGKTNLDEFAMGSSRRTPRSVRLAIPTTSRVSPVGPRAGARPPWRLVLPGSPSVPTLADPSASRPRCAGSSGPSRPTAWSPAMASSPLPAPWTRSGLCSRNVADAAAAARRRRRAGPGRLHVATRASAPWPRPGLAEGVDGLRVGVVTELAAAEGIADDVVARTADAADALAAAGAKVDEVSVPAAVYGLSAYYLIAPAEASSNLARYDGVRYGLRVTDHGGVPGSVRAGGGDDRAGGITEMYLQTRTAGFGAEVKRRIMLGTYALSAGYYDAYYGKAQRVRTLIIRDFESAYERFDVLLAPAAPTTAFRIGAKTADPLTMYLSDVCTIPSNLAGHPAISVPFGTGADGLPVGVQVLAPALGETVMFQAAAGLEAVAPPVAGGRLAVKGGRQ